MLCGHDGRRGFVYHLAVARSQRGRGIGRAIMERSLAALKEAGVLRALLLVARTTRAGRNSVARRREDMPSRSRWIRSMSAPAAPVPIAADKTEQLWREFAAPLRSFLRARTKSDADAEIYAGDLRPHPEAAADAARHVEDPGWVYRIARNASSITTGRGASTCRRTSSWRTTIPRASARRPAAQPATLHRRASPSYREPLVRHEFQGESLEEVAAALALTLTATKSRVRRARLMIRAMLDRCCRFEFDRRGRVIEATPRSKCSC